jgi:hypothetical protein
MALSELPRRLSSVNGKLDCNSNRLSLQVASVIAVGGQSAPVSVCVGSALRTEPLPSPRGAGNRCVRSRRWPLRSSVGKLQVEAPMGSEAPVVLLGGGLLGVAMPLAGESKRSERALSDNMGGRFDLLGFEETVRSDRGWGLFDLRDAHLSRLGVVRLQGGLI